MKKYLIALSLTLTACATTYNAAPQTTRIKGAEQPINITGELFRKQELLTTPMHVSIFFNGALQIKVPLDRLATGEANGEAYNGKPTSATCTSKQTSETNTEVRCMVFVDNEKTVTLTF
jgi:hypothetical protein